MVGSEGIAVKHSGNTVLTAFLTTFWKSGAFKWKSGRLTECEDGDSELGGNTVVAFSVVEGSDVGAGIESSSFEVGGSEVGHFATTQCALRIGEIVHVHRNSPVIGFSFAQVYGGGASDRGPLSVPKTFQSLRL